jgi:hypothetical protein
MAYGRGSYIEILKLIRDLSISSTAAEPINMLYIAPTMAVHSRMRIADFDGRQTCFDGGHEMQALAFFCG